MSLPRPDARRPLAEDQPRSTGVSHPLAWTAIRPAWLHRPIEALALLFAAALVGGSLNALGGGATFLVFPALVFAGVPALRANVTASVALSPASVATAFAYRDRLGATRTTLGLLAGASAVGSFLGAELLLATGPDVFSRMVPALMVAATLVFTFGALLPKGHAASGGRGGARLALVTLAQLAIGVYGGYFGAGMGILMLAAFGWLALPDFHATNALRGVMVAVVNIVSVAVFLPSSKIAWGPAAVVALGATLGGYGAARIVKRAPARRTRGVVIAAAWTMTLVVLWRARAR